MIRAIISILERRIGSAAVSINELSIRDGTRFIRSS
jgi:hypothetical protein